MFLLLAVTAGIAHAQDGGVAVELNKLESRGAACRAYLVLENGSGEGFESLKLDLVLFDREGIVAKRLAVETAPLAAGKTSLSVFDMAGVGCERAGRLLLNDVAACAGAAGERTGCLAAITPRTRTDIPFIK
jgi:hypothetical protein